MSLLKRVVLAAFLATSFASQTLAQDNASSSVVQGLVAFNSDEGMTRLARAAEKADFPALANQFEAQSNAAFCGPTTVAIVLNALHARSRDLPRDRSSRCRNGPGAGAMRRAESSARYKAHTAAARCGSLGVLVAQSLATRNEADDQDEE